MCRFSLCISFFIHVILKIFISTSFWCQNIKKLRKTFINSLSHTHTCTHTYRKKTPTHPKVHKYLDF